MPSSEFGQFEAVWRGGFLCTSMGQGSSLRGLPAPLRGIGEVILNTQLCVLCPQLVQSLWPWASVRRPRIEQQEPGKACSRKSLHRAGPAGRMAQDVWRGLSVGRNPSPVRNSLIWAQKAAGLYHCVHRKPGVPPRCLPLRSSTTKGPPLLLCVCVCVCVCSCVSALAGRWLRKCPRMSDTFRKGRI